MLAHSMALQTCAFASGCSFSLTGNSLASGLTVPEASDVEIDDLRTEEPSRRARSGWPAKPRLQPPAMRSSTCVARPAIQRARHRTGAGTAALRLREKSPPLHFKEQARRAAGWVRSRRLASRREGTAISPSRLHARGSSSACRGRWRQGPACWTSACVPRG